MTTQDFIAKTYDTASDRERRCSSVFTDYDGNVYSYGYHYPLLFKVDGLDIVNTRGYSNTTARHILWARRAEPNAIPVELPPHTRLDELTRDKLYYLLSKQRQEVVDEMSTKKRKDTGVYQYLTLKRDTIQGYMDRVQG